jgi:hypothetical protein
MPTFNGNGPLTVGIGLGDTIALFNADTLTAPVNSRVVTIIHSGPTVRGVRQFQMGFAASPTAVLDIYGSNNSPTAAGPDPNGQLLYTSTNKQNDYFEDDNGFAFYWAYLASQSAGGACTVTMHQV